MAEPSNAPASIIMERAHPAPASVSAGSGEAEARPIAPHTDGDREAASRMRHAEERGLKLAIVCRTIVFTVGFVWYVGSLLASGSAPTLQGMGVLLVLALIGIAHYTVVGSRFDRPWLKFAMVALDMVAICSLFIILPVSQSGDVPQIYAFRTLSAGLLMPFLALSTLTLSPRLTLWTGAVAAGAWLIAFRIVASGVEAPVSWSDMPQGASRAEFERVFFSPEFIGSGTRYTEAIVLILVAAILAVAVARARRVFFAQIEAEAERAAERARREEITERLGRFVPASVAQKVLNDPSALAPQVRHGAALVMDIENFTAYAEPRDPTVVIADLNRFLAQCAKAVGEADGVVIVFTGDGLLATFNTPLEIAAPEVAAFHAAQMLLECGQRNGFRLRVGVAAGPIAAGSIGSAERQAFTVYGNTVNRAARLEALAKDLSATVLTDDTSATALREAGVPLERAGAHALRGFSDVADVWCLPKQNAEHGA